VSGSREVSFSADGAELHATLTVPDGAFGVVLFAHGSGSSRFSPRNRYVAGQLQEAGLATCLTDLLTAHEEEADLRTAALRFDIALLADRLLAASDMLAREPATGELPLGYFGASTGAAAALVAAARRPQGVAAIVSRGGRPDLAGPALAQVQAPTLLIVGGLDTVVLELNRQAMAAMPGCVELEVVPGAGHLFEEPGALQRVAELARSWFSRYLAG
jgi:putative phosphoribosyl transferase